MNPTLIKVAGAGRAYQSVAQSTAIAIQDATDYLRNVSTIAVTSIGVGMAQVAADIPQGLTVISTAQSILSQAVKDFAQISAAAIKVATDYPQSFS